ncbi:MAG: helix-turn-helix transcriptional regulator [Ruminococcus sp.]|nr:helix-turn-helix transcriptional regulator [Ruminococcus sp.]
MKIGKVIRKYRKEKNMTQEEMATRLGVTAPAVNKWENENSYPDITLLAPIARLLGISVDALLSFQEELTPEEITSIVLESDMRAKTNTFEELFQWAKSIIETYPNCLMLIWQLASILDAQRLLKNVSNSADYDKYILDCYIRVLNSEDESLRTHAVDSLFGYYLRNEQYDTAEKYLKYYSIQNPERKLKQAIIYSNTGKTNDAYKTYEQLLFSEYQMLTMLFHNLYLLAIQDQNLAKAHFYTDKQQALAKLFEMGKYHETACRLDLATYEKNADMILDTMEAMMDSLEKITDFSNSELYTHMDFKKASNTFTTDMKKELLNCFRDEETYGFLKDNARWEKLIQD